MSLSVKESNKYLIKCTICGYKFKNRQEIKKHLLKIHNMEMIDYILKVKYNDIHPLCGCGCGGKVTFTNRLSKNWFSKHLANHYPITDEIKKNVAIGLKKVNMEKLGTEYPLQNKDIMNKTKETMLKRYGVEHGFQSSFIQNKTSKNICSKTELKILNILNGESSFSFKGRRYDIRVGNNLYEIDGNYFHTDKLTNLTVVTLVSIINDHRKILAIDGSDYKLYKIFISNLPKEINEKSLQSNSYIPNFELNYDDIIMRKEYIQKFFQSFDNKKLNKYLKKFYNFLIYFKQDIFKNYKKVDIINSIKYLIGFNEGNNYYDFTIKNVVDNIKIN